MLDGSIWLLTYQITLVANASQPTMLYQNISRLIK